MFSLNFDLYPFLRRVLFMMDAEKSHHIALMLLKNQMVPAVNVAPDEVLQTSMCGMNFAHPIGLAAGFDKQAEVISECFSLGFSFIELGGVTPLPQPGNPAPRLFRIPAEKAIINRFGFNSVGTEVFLRRLVAYHDTQTRSKPRILGINLAKNKETEDAADDYVKGVNSFAKLADFLTVNISSPNTPGLRDMQKRDALQELLQRVMQARTAAEGTAKLFLKIAPDVTEEQLRDIAEVAIECGVDAIIIGNTTLSRPWFLPPPAALEAGGLSGKPLFALSTSVLGQLYQLTRGKIPLIGCGGVFTGEDAYAKIRAGASLIQIYSVLVYEGPTVVARIAAELAALLKRDGFASVGEAVGADFREI